MFKKVTCAVWVYACKMTQYNNWNLYSCCLIKTVNVYCVWCFPCLLFVQSAFKDNYRFATDLLHVGETELDARGVRGRWEWRERRKSMERGHEPVFPTSLSSEFEFANSKLQPSPSHCSTLNILFSIFKAPHLASLSLFFFPVWNLS